MPLGYLFLVPVVCVVLCKTLSSDGAASFLWAFFSAWLEALPLWVWGFSQGASLLSSTLASVPNALSEDRPSCEVTGILKTSWFFVSLLRTWQTGSLTALIVHLF